LDFLTRLKVAKKFVMATYEDEGDVYGFADFMGMEPMPEVGKVKCDKPSQLAYLESAYKVGKYLDGYFHLQAVAEMADATGLLDWLKDAPDIMLSVEAERTAVDEPTTTALVEVVVVEGYDPAVDLVWMNQDMNKLPHEVRERLYWVRPEVEAMFSKGVKAKLFGMMVKGPLSVTAYVAEMVQLWGGLYLSCLTDEDKARFVVGRLLQYKGQFEYRCGTLTKLV